MIEMFAQESPIGVAKLIDIYKSQTDIINTLWNFLAIVALAILGYIYKDSEIRKDWKIKIGLSIGYTIFTIGNLFALRSALSISIAASSALTNLKGTVAPEVVPVLEAHTNSSLSIVTIFHIALDLLVLLAMWLPNLVSQTRKTKTKANK